MEAPRIWVTRNLLCVAQSAMSTSRCQDCSRGATPAPFYARFAGTTDLADSNLVAEPWGQPFEFRLPLRTKDFACGGRDRAWQFTVFAASRYKGQCTTQSCAHAEDFRGATHSTV